MITIINWNIAFSQAPWHELVAMNADVALLQETCAPPPEIAGRVQFSPYRHWLSEHYPLTSFRPARVIKLSERVNVEWFEQVAPHRHDPEPRQMPVSAPGLIDAAIITPKDGTDPFIVVSMYGGWQSTHPNARPGLGYPDASTHRIISDLMTFVPNMESEMPRHRIIAAGDLNMSFDGIGPDRARAQTIPARFNALGLEYVGPRFPNGRKAEPLPRHLTEQSLDVPTFYTVAQGPAEAAVQLDHVFVSRGLHRRVAVRALNGIDEWGSSDHCRVLIEVTAEPK